MSVVLDVVYFHHSSMYHSKIVYRYHYEAYNALFVYHTYLVCILFVVPSLQLSTFFLLEQENQQPVCYSQDRPGFSVNLH